MNIENMLLPDLEKLRKKLRENYHSLLKGHVISKTGETAYMMHMRLLDVKAEIITREKEKPQKGLF